MPTAGDIGAEIGGNRPQTENQGRRAGAPAAREATAVVAGRDSAFVKLELLGSAPRRETAPGDFRARGHIKLRRAEGHRGFEIRKPAKGRATTAHQG